MQDWWTDEGLYLEKHIDYISQPNLDNYGRHTEGRLYNNQNWREAIWGDKYSWLVTNAVWGVRRKGNQQNGLLCADTHKHSFPVWSSLLIKLCQGRKSPLKVVFAGEWKNWPALGNETRAGNNMCLNDYLNQWAAWSTRNKGSIQQTEVPNGIADLVGTAYFGKHPSAFCRLLEVPKKDD